MESLNRLLSLLKDVEVAIFKTVHLSRGSPSSHLLKQRDRQPTNRRRTSRRQARGRNHTDDDGSSREFADVLRRFPIPRFVIQPVQALDRPLVRPRGELTLSTAAWRNSTGFSTIRRIVHSRSIRPARSHPAPEQVPGGETRLSQCDPLRGNLAQRIDVGYMTVKRALGIMHA